MVSFDVVFSNKIGSGREIDPRYVAEHQTRHVLFFNRVPKCGSEMLVLLLQWLQARNGFRHVRLKNTVKRYLTTDQQVTNYKYVYVVYVYMK